jgi:flagellar motor switch protein FliN/FliY
MLEQTDIDSLLEAANALAEEAQEELGAPGPEPARPAPASGGPSRQRSHPSAHGSDNEVGGILRMRVPVIAVLAEREMPFHDVLRWTPGSIIEFERSSDAELDVIVGNRTVGAGQAVKVGENFGIRITLIGDVGERIRAMGP